MAKWRSVPGRGFMWPSIARGRTSARLCCSSSARPADQEKPATDCSAAGWIAPAVRPPNSGLGDIDVLGLRQEDEADDCGDGRKDDRIPETCVDIAGRGHDRECGRGQQAAEPTVADMVRQ